MASFQHFRLMRLAGAANPFQSMANISFNQGGGGSTQSSSTAYQTNIPEYAQPYVTSMLNATQQQLFNVQNGQVQGFAPYVPYSANPADYVAGFSPMQQQAFKGAANLQTPGQFGYGSDLASQAGVGALGTTGQALGYGQAGSAAGQKGAEIGQGALGYGQMGAGYGAQGAGTAGAALGYGGAAGGIGRQAVGAAQQGFGAQAAYQAQATNPYAVQAYMNPYVEASLAPQLQLLNQQQALQNQQIAAQGVRSGAYGGSRQAVAQGLNQQNFDLARQQAIAQGYDKAFQQAQQAQQFGANLGIQGLGAGTQALQTGIQGQLAGLQGVQGAQAAYNLGMQGAGLGLQGVQGALAGNAQALQGAQIGLQGVQGAQAGYGLANQAAGQMGQLGTQQLAAQQAILNQQNQFGTQQQQNQQQIINQAVQDYANAQQYPLMQLGTMSNMLRGLPLQSATTQQYIAQPNLTTQAIGTLGAGASLYGAMSGRKAGGILKAKKMAKGGITSYDVGGSVRAKLYDMPPEQLKEELDSPSAEVRKMARGILMEKQVQGKAGGGIIAFAGGTPDPEIIPEAPAPQETATDTQYQAPQAPVPQAAPAPQAAPTGPARGQSAAAGIMATDPGALLTQAAQKAAVNANRSREDIYAELLKGHAPDTARQEYRKQIMEERANLKDEDTRQNWLRAAQFFASWGSTPGNTLAAGLTAMKNIIPDVISDQKEQKKYKKEIDKAIYQLDEAARLEQNGLWDKAGEIKEKLAEHYYKTLGPVSTYASATVHAAATKFAATQRGAGAGAGAADKSLDRWADNLRASTDELKKLKNDAEKDPTLTMDVSKMAPDSPARKQIEAKQAAHAKAVEQAQANYDLSKQQVDKLSQGSTKQEGGKETTGLPLPPRQEDLVSGKVYNTSRGPAKWDGKQFVAS